VTAPFLTRIPLDLSDPAVRELLALLSDTYYKAGPVTDMVRAVAGRPGRIDFDQTMERVCVDVFTVLANQGKLGDLLQLLVDGDANSWLMTRLAARSGLPSSPHKSHEPVRVAQPSSYPCDPTRFGAARHARTSPSRCSGIAGAP
jgi:hypothetical protein